MTEQQAFKAGFLLECARMGFPAEYSTELLKKAFIGQALGTAANLGMSAGRGVISGANSAISGAGSLGGFVGKKNIDDQMAAPNLDAVRKLLLAEHYRRANRALASAQQAA